MSTDSFANWQWIGGTSPKSLVPARASAHHAAQLLALVGASYVPARADDGHTSMIWLDPREALVTEIVDAIRPFRVGLRLADLTLLFLDIADGDVGVFPLGERTRDEAIAWLGARAGEAGLDPAAMHKRLHFSIAPHATDSGAPFVRQKEALEELARWYRNANSVLQAHRARIAGAGEVRCWPHHFDIATLVTCSEGPFQTIGIGMSPGDTSYDEPYFYVGPSPRPTFALAPLAIGRWHTTDWFGGVLTASDIVTKSSALEQVALVDQFVDGALAELRSRPRRP